MLKMGASKEATPTKIFPRNPICMLCSESKDSHANLLHPQLLGVFWVDARSFSRPSHFLREKALGKRLRKMARIKKVAKSGLFGILFKGYRKAKRSKITYVVGDIHKAKKEEKR